MELLANLMMVIILQYMYQIITMYTLNVHNVTCQLQLNKAGKIIVYLINFPFFWTFWLGGVSYRVCHLTEQKPQDFPGGPVVKTPSFHCRGGHGFDLWPGS